MGTGVAFDIKSECTFIGDPTPTLATCVQTLSYHNTPLVTTSSITVTGTDNPSTGIYPAFLRMTKTEKPTITDELTTADQYAETKGPLTTEESTVSETSNLGPTSPEKFTMTDSSTAIWTGTTIPIATGVQIPPRPGNSTSYLKGTKTVTLIVTETPPTITCKCNCEYPTHSQYDGRVVSSTTPNKGNTIIGKQIAVSLVGAIFAIILFCM
jgi:hypothetical protein